MKIAINLINYNSMQLTGTGNFIKRIFDQINKNGTEFTFHIFLQKHILPHAFSIDETSGHFKIISVPSFKNRVERILYEQIAMPFMLKEYGIIYSPSLGIPLFCKPKKVVTIHDMTPFVFPQKYSFIQRSYIKTMTRLTTIFADKVITVSNNSMEDILRFTKCKREKIDVIYNFIPDAILEKEKEVSKFFMTVSTIQPGKNIENIIKSFELFMDRIKDPEYKLYIIGKRGWNYNHIISLAEKSIYKNNIFFLGYLSENLIKEYYSKTTALIYISFYEGFGIPPLEAMYYSKLSIVSNVSSLPEVVGQTGLLVDPCNTDDISDQMVNITNSSLRERLKRKIPDQLAKFDPYQQVNKFLNILKCI